MRPSPNRYLNQDAPDDIILPASGPNKSGSFFDYINPLQHLPVVGTVYRAVTGSTISPSARVVGGLLYGGPIGFASSLVNAIVETASGKDIGEHAMAAVGIGGSRGNFPTLDTSANFAQAAPPPPPQNVDARTMAALGGSGLQLASAGGDTGSMLATWIAGPGQEFPRNVAQAEPPTRAAAAPAQVAPTPTPIQQASASPAGGGDNRSAGNAPAGRSLVEYRASAINTSGSFRSIGPAGPSGVSRMPSSPIQPASLQTPPSTRANAGETAFSAQVQTQLQAQSQRDTGDADSYFAAQMAAGLERYSRLQRERLGEGQRL